MAKKKAGYALMLTCWSALVACQATRFVGTTCADDCALHEEQAGLTCSVYERVVRVSIRDTPFEHPELALCTKSPLKPNEEGLVHCRMAWKLSGPPVDQRSASVPTPRCEDYDFLSPASDDPFNDPEGGPVCEVRQVTAAQAADGMHGWYYVSAAPVYCNDSGPAVFIPRQRPDEDGWQVEAFLMCSAVQTLTSSGAVEDVDIAECAAPQHAQPASDIGKKCSRGLRQSDGFSTLSLELDPEQCESGACVTLPLIEPICDAVPGGIPACRTVDSGCSCRCAGEADDPGPFCGCPDSHECKPILSAFTGTPETRGSYCVPKGLYP